MKLKLKIAKINKSEKDDRIASISPTLGPVGIKPMEVLKEFEDRTKDYQPGTEFIVKLDVVLNPSTKRASKYNMLIKKPILTHIIKKELKISKLPGSKSGMISIEKSTLEKIIQATYNEDDLITIDNHRKHLIGSLKSKYIKVV